MARRPRNNMSLSLEGIDPVRVLEYIRQGRLAAGVDEAGRGPLAGPVVAAAVIPSLEIIGSGIDDSKKLTHKQRESFYDLIVTTSTAFSIVAIDSVTVDAINIFGATMRAMREAVEGLSVVPEIAFIDGPHAPPCDVPCVPVKFGDAHDIGIAAASILAKVYRDRLMAEYDRTYSGYGFAAHKGYGTKAHLEALAALGPCAIHRRSFAPVRTALESRSET